MNQHVETLYAAIEAARVSIMVQGAGDLDHPALDDLDAALRAMDSVMAQLQDVQKEALRLSREKEALGAILGNAYSERDTWKEWARAEVYGRTEGVREPFIVPDITKPGESHTAVFHALRDLVDDGLLGHDKRGYWRIPQPGTAIQVGNRVFLTRGDESA
jgi:hypothetical protein